MRRSHFVGCRKSIYRILAIVWPKSDCNPGRLRPSRVRTLRRKDGGAVGAVATHFDDVLGCGEQDVPAEIRLFSEYCLRAMSEQNSPFAYVGMALPAESTSESLSTSPGH